MLCLSAILRVIQHKDAHDHGKVVTPELITMLHLIVHFRIMRSSFLAYSSA